MPSGNLQHPLAGRAEIDILCLLRKSPGLTQVIIWGGPPASLSVLEKLLLQVRPAHRTPPHARAALRRFTFRHKPALIWKIRTLPTLVWTHISSDTCLQTPSRQAHAPSGLSTLGSPPRT